jgi:hypothetical protein
MAPAAEPFGGDSEAAGASGDPDGGVGSDDICGGQMDEERDSERN